MEIFVVIVFKPPVIVMINISCVVGIWSLILIRHIERNCWLILAGYVENVCGMIFIFCR
ncbi:hypothetical protein BD408DRAFT_413736 [Parasitella parasitica]|nr:hypothetical protein BD408DRAFT_413736 [Parasitella parasitica]